MKQCITRDQYYTFSKEINDKGNSELHKKIFFRELPGVVEDITIGKMIEILGDKFLGIHITTSEKYQVALDIILEDERLAVFQDTELCDALWKAVKHVLEVAASDESELVTCETCKKYGVDCDGADETAIYCEDWGDKKNENMAKN